MAVRRVGSCHTAHSQEAERDECGARLTVCLWDEVAYIYHVSLTVVDSRRSLHKRAQRFIS